MHHHIVALDAWHVPIPSTLFDLPAPTSYTLETCPSRLERPAQIYHAIKNASIIAVTVSPLDATALSESTTPNLKLVVAVAAGTDGIDLVKCRERGIRVLNSPSSNAQSVAEHAVALYFAARRRLITLQHAMLDTPEWLTNGTLAHKMNIAGSRLPLSCQEEVVGVVGHGAVGQAVASTCRGLGMTVLVSARKSRADAPNLSSDEPALSGQESRIPFAEVLHRSTVLILCLPRNTDTIGLISTVELQAMSSSCVLINVSRGGIVDETALLQFLREKKIAGAAFDVFAREPSGAGSFWREGDSPLLHITRDEAAKVNLVLTPHVAWYTQKTVDNYLFTLKQNVEQWCQGKESNVVV